MAINVEIVKNGNENNASVLRRFRKRVQGAGVLTKARSLRYKKRSPSTLTKQKSALKRITKRVARERLYKLGKLSLETTPTHTH